MSRPNYAYELRTREISALERIADALEKMVPKEPRSKVKVVDGHYRCMSCSKYIPKEIEHCPDCGSL